MQLPTDQMPLQTAEQITLSAEEKRLAAAEVRGGDIRGHVVNFLAADVSDRYSFGKYLVDPCRLGWSKGLRVLALAMRFVKFCRAKAGLQKPPINIFDQEELDCAANYFFRIGTAEFKKFGKMSEVKNSSIEKEKILYFTGRLLDTSSLVATEKVLFDISPKSFGHFDGFSAF